MDPTSIEAWITPGGLAAVAGAVAWLVKTAVSQDRRIEAGREASEHIKATLERYQTRECCSEHHRELPSKGSMSEAFEQIRSLERAAAEDRRGVEVALANINGSLQRLEDKIDALACEERRPLGRTKTNPGFDPKRGG